MVSALASQACFTSLLHEQKVGGSIPSGGKSFFPSQAFFYLTFPTSYIVRLSKYLNGNGLSICPAN